MKMNFNDNFFTDPVSIEHAELFEYVLLDDDTGILLLYSEYENKETWHIAYNSKINELEDYYLIINESTFIQGPINILNMFTLTKQQFENIKLLKQKNRNKNNG